MNEDIIVSKAATIERCAARIQEVYDGNPDNLADYTKQDSIVLNIQRACEASIDLAMHLVSENRLGVPKASRDAFLLLQENGILSNELASNLVKMVGFRNIAVHDCQAIDLQILQAIVEKHVQDFTALTTYLLARLDD
ncbi:type VII toxin-antitoxin system HepT family RNase toxin [Sporosarcina sp. NCCP-2716]|uniref:type VII toxin-antitoxin system HepT family RNase toxin n=1 Tax=Sporosarcina sp. NCCP-2716 TaxID=2943679 RepID=UPI0025598B2A|nr:DUF86 domain-containing protein [Sporosarcina sp. NCCP-2716]